MRPACELATDMQLVNQMSVELGYLFEEQMEALKGSAFARLTPMEAQEYAKRRERICELCAELVELKGHVAETR